MQPNVQTAKPARRLLLGGKIVFNNKGSVFDCMVRTMSSDGAGLRMKSTVGVPSTFSLIIELTGETHICTVEQRTETDLSVAFLT